jgi:hypothetical protein
MASMGHVHLPAPALIYRQKASTQQTRSSEMTFATITRKQFSPRRTADLAGIGERFGLYRALSGEPVTASQLAKRTFTDVNFINEWLEQQVYEGFVTYDASTTRYANYCTLPQAA